MSDAQIVHLTALVESTHHTIGIVAEGAASLNEKFDRLIERRAHRIESHRDLSGAPQPKKRRTGKTS